MKMVGLCRTCFRRAIHHVNFKTPRNLRFLQTAVETPSAKDVKKDRIGVAPNSEFVDSDVTLSISAQHYLQKNPDMFAKSENLFVRMQSTESSRTDESVSKLRTKKELFVEKLQRMEEGAKNPQQRRLLQKDLQDLTNEYQKLLAQEMLSQMDGESDDLEPKSDMPCGGCGALLHCQLPDTPGYLPANVFKEKKRRKSLSKTICLRCELIEKHSLALKMHVTPVEYKKIISKVRTKQALVMLVVDVLTFPCGMFGGLMELVGHDKKVVVVANKVDLLPCDALDKSGKPVTYLNRIKTAIRMNILDNGICSVDNLLDVVLVSAKTGFGIESLITKLSNVWNCLDGARGDIYLVGSANVGKSSLFNALLHSDLCKPQSSGLINEAVVSIWPGTTLNLLKFPLLLASPQRKFQRFKRMQGEQRILHALMQEQTVRHRNHDKIFLPTSYGYIGRTFLEPQTADQLDPGSRLKQDAFRYHVNEGAIAVSGEETRSHQVLDPQAEEYRHGHWLFDTPGALTEDLLTDRLMTQELLAVTPAKLVLPRICIVRPGKTILVAGLARIDVLAVSSKDGNETVWVSVFVSDRLPIHVIPTENADKFYADNLGTDILKVPEGGKERLEKFPKLESKILEVEGQGLKFIGTDVTLACAGWIGVSLAKSALGKLKVHTPEGVGIYMRNPSVLPYTPNFLRGHRRAYRYYYTFSERFS